jgi:hypothetical protein
MKRSAWEELDVTGRIKPKPIVKKQDGNVWIAFAWLWLGPLADSFERGNEMADSIKRGKFLDWLREISAC